MPSANFVFFKCQKNFRPSAVHTFLYNEKNIIIKSPRPTGVQPSHSFYGPPTDLSPDRPPKALWCAAFDVPQDHPLATSPFSCLLLKMIKFLITFGGHSPTTLQPSANLSRVLVHGTFES